MATAPFQKTRSAKSGSWQTRLFPLAYTPGLEGTPNEVKLKYLADTTLLT